MPIAGPGMCKLVICFDRCRILHKDFGCFFLLDRALRHLRAADDLTRTRKAAGCLATCEDLPVLEIADDHPHFLGAGVVEALEVLLDLSMVAGSASARHLSLVYFCDVQLLQQTLIKWIQVVLLVVLQQEHLLKRVPGLVDAHACRVKAHSHFSVTAWLAACVVAGLSALFLERFKSLVWNSFVH